jgi:hypothetical protein
MPAAAGAGLHKMLHWRRDENPAAMPAAGNHHH